MTTRDATLERLAFLLETVTLEAEHLCVTDQRLLSVPFTSDRAATLPHFLPCAQAPGSRRWGVNVEDPRVQK